MKDKKYGLLTATSLVVGVVIGIGIFFKAGSVMAAVEGQEKLAIAAWVIAAVLVGLSAFTISGLAGTINKNGGLQVYVEKTWGKPLGFVVGFFQSFVYFPALIAGIALVVGDFTASIFSGWSFAGTLTFQIIVGLLALAFVFTSNLFTRMGGIFQQISTYIKVIPLLAVIVGGLFFANGHSDLAKAAADGFESSNTSAFILIGKALIPILFAFDGWILVTTMAGDIEKPEKNLPIAIIGGVAFIAVIYIAFSTLLFSIAPGAAYASGNFNIFNALADVYGTWFSKLLNVFIVISALGVLNGVTMAGFRAPRVVAEAYEMTGHRHIAGLNERTGLPVKSGIVISTVALVYFLIVAISGYININNYGKLIDLLFDGTVAFMWIIYVLIFIGIAYEILRKRLKLSYVYVVTSVVSALVGSWAVLSSLNANPLYVQLTLVIIVIALAFASKAKKFKNIH